MSMLKRLKRYRDLLKSIKDDTQFIRTNLGLSLHENLTGDDTSNEPFAKMAHRMGLHLLLDSSSLVDREVLINNCWEPEQIGFVTRVLSNIPEGQDTYFLDIGAYWGLYSLIACRLGVKNIICFEPDRANYAQLLAQQFLNGATGKINSYNLAVSDKEEVLNFWDSNDHPDGNRGGVGFIGMDTEKKGHSVQAVTIDKFLKLTNALIIAKIDVEGHEARVLRGMKDTISECEILIQVESFPHHEAEIEAVSKEVGLKKVHHIGVDAYYTNMPPEKLSAIFKLDW